MWKEYWLDLYQFHQHHLMAWPHIIQLSDLIVFQPDKTLLLRLASKSNAVDDG